MLLMFFLVICAESDIFYINTYDQYRKIIIKLRDKFMQNRAKIAVSEIDDEACLNLSQADWPEIKRLFLSSTHNIKPGTEYNAWDVCILAEQNGLL